MTKQTVEAVKSKSRDKVKKEVLPSQLFDVPWKPELVQQVAVSMMANQRRPVAHTKDRSQVRGGGRKPWRQKGTGRARHGSIRSPLWVGGGVTFGPSKEKKYTKKINKKMRRLAVLNVLSEKKRRGLVKLIPQIPLKQAKTKLMAQFLAKHNPKLDRSVLIACASEEYEVLKKASRNLVGVEATMAGQMDLLSLLRYSDLYLTKKGLEEIKKRFEKNS